MSDHTAPAPATPNLDGMSRRTIIRGAAWSVPVVAAAMATPLAAASGTPANFAIESNFGIGWYPVTQGNTAAGGLQYDAEQNGGKYLRVTGTTAGDVITNAYFEVLIAVGWPLPSFSALPGSNADWSTLAPTGATETANGITYNVFQSVYTGGPVVATGATTNVPVDFFFRSLSPYYAGQTAFTRRFVTVNATPVTLVRNPAQIIDTNVALSSAPAPTPPV